MIKIFSYVICFIAYLIFQINWLFFENPLADLIAIGVFMLGILLWMTSMLIQKRNGEELQHDGGIAIEGIFAISSIPFIIIFYLVKQFLS